MPAELRRRFATAYATIELADSMAELGVDQTGPARRRSGPFTLQAIRTWNMTSPAPDDDFHSQTALLEQDQRGVGVGLRLANKRISSC